MPTLVYTVYTLGGVYPVYGGVYTLGGVYALPTVLPYVSPGYIPPYTHPGYTILPLAHGLVYTAVMYPAGCPGKRPWAQRRE